MNGEYGEWDRESYESESSFSLIWICWAGAFLLGPDSSTEEDTFLLRDTSDKGDRVVVWPS